MIKKRGFTLIELLVVIAIIGILATIIIVSYGNMQAKSRDSKRKGDLQAIASALDIYYVDNKLYPKSSNYLATDLNYNEHDSSGGSADCNNLVPPYSTTASVYCFIISGYLTNNSVPRDPRFNSVSNSSYHYYIVSNVSGDKGYKLMTDPRAKDGTNDVDSYEASGDIDATCITNASDFADKETSSDNYTGKPTSNLACNRLIIQKKIKTAYSFKITSLSLKNVTW